MSQFDISKLPKGSKGFMHDWGSDQRAFKVVPWGKAMMWIFLVSDTFVFSIYIMGMYYKCLRKHAKHIFYI